MPGKLTKTLSVGLFLGFLVAAVAGCQDDRFRASLGELQVVPDPVEFGEVPVSTVKTLDVTLTNHGTAPVHLKDLRVEENSEDFSLSIPEELVFPYAVAPGNQVVFTVRYHPQKYPEQDQGIVRIDSSDKDAPEYDLICTGTAVEPVLLIDPVPVDFGSTRVMGTGAATLTITHTGSNPDPVDISTIQITDDGDGDFHIQDNDDLPITLQSGEDTKVHLSYTPLLIDDADEGVLTIESTAESQEHMEIALLGSSHAPAIEVSTTALNFGTVTQGANPSLPFSIRSVGTDPLTINDLALTVISSPKFTFVPASISDPIDPGGEVLVTVTYVADDRGDDDGSLQILHNDPLSTSVFVQLHGRTPEPDVDVDPDNATIQIAHDSHEQTVDIKIYNVGDEDLLVTGMDFEDENGSFSIVTEPVWAATIEPDGTPALVQVKFEKYVQTAGDDCYLTFHTDDRDEPTVVVKITGSYTP